jgi:hypothetical protein
MLRADDPLFVSLQALVNGGTSLSLSLSLF